MEFDRTDSSYVENKIEDANLRLQIGRVVKVFEHTAPDDNSNFEANVILRDEDKERRGVPIITERRGEIAPPEVDDKVVVGFLDSVSESPVILGNLYDVATRPPLGRAGMYRLKRGNMYLEAHEDGNWARIAHKTDAEGDNGTPNAKVEIEDDGGTPVVNIEAEGDVIVDSNNGKVILGGSSGQPVARQGDPVEDGSNTQIGTISDGSNEVDAA